MPFGDVTRAPYFAALKGPRGPGTVLVGADLPGHRHAARDVELPAVRPCADDAAEREATRSKRDRFVAYASGRLRGGRGHRGHSDGAPSRGPRTARTVMPPLSRCSSCMASSTRISSVVPLDTTGAGASAAPTPISTDRSATAKSARCASRRAALARTTTSCSTSGVADGMKIGDEVEVYRTRTEPKSDDRPGDPEVADRDGAGGSRHAVRRDGAHHDAAAAGDSRRARASA